MQTIVDSLREKGKIYKKLQEVVPKDLGIRNKIKIYKATDTSGYFSVIISVSQKSRVLMKDVRKFEEIYSKLTTYFDHNFKYKLIFIDAPLCSKAKEAFKTQGWRIQ